ncbi:MAG: SoxR reducing system RseC family protein [Desulfatirhabdiaceae bacterium]
MATEEGIIIRIGDNDIAWVKTVRSSACESCSARHSCSTQDSGKEMEVEAFNPIAAKEGDRVIIRMKTSTLLNAAFMMYIVPILFMLAGALIGDGLSSSLRMDSVLLSTFMGLFSFILSFVLIRYKTGRKEVRDRYRPRIIRICPS